MAHVPLNPAPERQSGGPGIAIVIQLAPHSCDAWHGRTQSPWNEPRTPQTPLGRLGGGDGPRPLQVPCDDGEGDGGGERRAAALQALEGVRRLLREPSAGKGGALTTRLLLEDSGGVHWLAILKRDWQDPPPPPGSRGLPDWKKYPPALRTKVEVRFSMCFILLILFSKSERLPKMGIFGKFGIANKMRHIAQATGKKIR